jgi:hypothetical protein
MNDSNNDITEVTQTARIQKPSKKPTVKAVPVLPKTGKPMVAKPKITPVKSPVLKAPRTDTVKLKVVKHTPPTLSPEAMVPKKVQIVTPVTPVTPKESEGTTSQVKTKTVKMETPSVSTKTVKLTNPIKKSIPSSDEISPVTKNVQVVKPTPKKPVAPKATVTKTVGKKSVSTVRPKKKATAKKEEISFDVSDFEDEATEPSILFMLMSLASAAMFTAGLVITLI